MLTQHEASEAIAKKVKLAYQIIEEAEKIADEYGIHFSFGLSYPGGCGYTPNEGWESSSSSC